MLLFTAVVASLLGSLSGLESVALEFEDISCTLEKGGKPRLLLDGVSGAARKGQLTAIMGPSGSGKTLMLNSLCGQVRQTAGLNLEGRLRVNGQESCPSDLQLAYVKQEDSFYSEMTVRETLTFHAKLRLPRNSSEALIEEKVEKLLGLLGLRKSVDTPVGSVSSRGISGGERKRLSIACELISDPPLIFLDEPLSGLDSFQAANVMGRLRKLADAGHTVVLTLHQPSTSLYRMVDDLLVLSEGKPMYYGPAAGLAKWAATHGYPHARDVPPSEHFLDVVSVDYQTPQREAESRARIAAFFKAARAKPALPSLGSSWFTKAWETLPEPAATEPGAVVVLSSNNDPIANPLTQFRLLLRRAWRQVSRAKGVLLIKAVQQVMVALIYGGIYKLDLSQRSVQDRLGLLSLITVGASNLAVAGTIRAFPKEKVLVFEERSKRLYGVFTYFMSKLIADVPLNAALSLLFGALIYPLVGLQRNFRKFALFTGLVTLESLASSALGLLLGSFAPTTDAALALFPPVRFIIVIVVVVVVTVTIIVVVTVTIIVVIIYIYCYCYIIIIIIIIIPIITINIIIIIITIIIIFIIFVGGAGG
ncbi:P-loop containing nucleoside triphosphate hydrolase protein [Pavlovales sp. CCMP2436]|nr:P-loop containing nucleoside triphosphate hydrolase protein [Pavlovales sp. CCMP2436]